MAETKKTTRSASISLNPEAPAFTLSSSPKSSPSKKQAWVSKTKLAKQNSPQSAPATAPAGSAQRFSFAKTPKSATFAKGPDWRQQSQTPSSHGFALKKGIKVDTSFSSRPADGVQTAPAGSLNFGFQKTNLKEIKYVCRGCNKVLNSSLQLVEHQNGKLCPANRGLISPEAAAVAATPTSLPVANPLVTPNVASRTATRNTPRVKAHVSTPVAVQTPQYMPVISPMSVTPASKFHELAVTTPTNSVMSVAMKLNSLIKLVVEQHGKLKSAIELINSQNKEIQELKQKVATLEKSEENSISTPVNVVSSHQAV